MSKIFLLLSVSCAIVFICGCDKNITREKEILMKIVKAQYWHVNMNKSCKQDFQGELFLSIEKGRKILERKKIIDLNKIHHKDKFMIILQYITPKFWRIYVFSETTGCVSYDLPEKLLKDCIISSRNLSKKISLGEYLVKYGAMEVSQNFSKCNNNEYGIRLVFKEKSTSNQQTKIRD